MLTRLPSGPSGSTIAGILLLGLIARKSGAICSPLVMFTGITLYGSPISSSATLILRPFGVFQVCSSMVIFVSGRLAEEASVASSWIIANRGTSFLPLLLAGSIGRLRRPCLDRRKPKRSLGHGARQSTAASASMLVMLSVPHAPPDHY